MGKKDSSKEENGLKDHGIIYISGTIEEKVSESVCKEIIEFNISGKVEHIQIIINSSGGSCTAGFAIIDIMEWYQAPYFYNRNRDDCIHGAFALYYRLKREKGHHTKNFDIVA